MRLRHARASTYPGNEATCVEIGRYALFAGANYYPNGGWEDFRFLFNFPEKAREHALEVIASGAEISGMWWHVVDLLSGEIVDSSERDSA